MAPLPQARVVRKGGIAVAPPPVPFRDRVAAIEENMGPRVRGFVAAVFGLWPVTAVVLLAFGLMCIAMLQNAP
jgi:nitrate reductase NapE component